MKAKITCTEIAEIIYLTDDELDSQDLLLLSSHIKTCSSCNEIRQDFLAARRLSLQLTSDSPPCPDFIRSTDKLIRSHTFRGKIIAIIRYSSTIAAVFFFVLFTWEQAVSVRKIVMLEKQVQTAVNPPAPGYLDRLTLARSVLTTQEWNGLTAGLNVNRALSNPQDLLRIKILVENRVRSGLPLTQKTNAITIKNLIK